MPRAMQETDKIGHHQHVSATQLTNFLFCEQRFAYAYALRLPRRRGASLAIGSSVDTAATAFNRLKMETHENQPLADVVEQAVTYMETEEKPHCDEWSPDDKFGAIKDELPGLVKVLYDGALSVTQPISVQQELRMDMGNWHFLGYLDVVDSNGIITDYKTTKRSWSAGKEMTEVQPVIYTMAYPGASTFRWDIAVRNKTPKHQQVTRIVTPGVKTGMKALAGAAKSRMDMLRLDPDRAIPTGYGGMLCTKTYCDFWQQCQKRWGQPIKD